jgi:hypothetical protein
MLEVNEFGPVQLNDFAPVPPEVVEFRFKVLPKQIGVFEEIVVMVTAVGWVIVADAVVEQPLLSVIVTLYVPAASPMMSWVVAPFDHK